jgi:pimeloyl-ACP methyl ester carboxylesterase
MLLLEGCASVPSTAVSSTPYNTTAYALRGQGSPVIVLQSGLGDGKDTWAPVLPTLAQQHAVFAYDRPGYGGSSEVFGARDPCTVATELHTLLHAEGVKPPYVLVGHSLGGLYQLAFAKLYPKEVAALVLLDPTHPEHWPRMQAQAPAAAALLKGVRLTLFSGTMRREFDDMALCMDRLKLDQPTTVPARVLVSTVRPAIEQGAFDQMLQGLRPDWLRFTGAAQLQSVPAAGHYIHKDQPAVVVQAVNAVLP